MNENELKLAELYVAYFDRAPDASGLEYWVNEMENGMDYSDIASNWATQQDEFIKTYGENPDQEKFITQIYQNVLGREPDAEGLSYWSDKMSIGEINSTNMIQTILNGAKAVTGSTEDASYLNNRAQIGLKLAETGINDIDFAHKVVEAVSADASTVSITSNIIDMAAKSIEQADANTEDIDLSAATTALESITEMLNDKNSLDTLGDRLESLNTTIQSIAKDAENGTSTELSEALKAATTEVEATIPSEVTAAVDSALSGITSTGEIIDIIDEVSTEDIAQVVAVLPDDVTAAIVTSAITGVVPTSSIEDITNGLSTDDLTQIVASLPDETTASIDSLLSDSTSTSDILDAVADDDLTQAVASLPDETTASIDSLISSSTSTTDIINGLTADDLTQILASLPDETTASINSWISSSTSTSDILDAVSDADISQIIANLPDATSSGDISTIVDSLSDSSQGNTAVLAGIISDQINSTINDATI